MCVNNGSLANWLMDVELDKSVLSSVIAEGVEDWMDEQSSDSTDFFSSMVGELLAKVWFELFDEIICFNSMIGESTSLLWIVLFGVMSEVEITARVDDSEF